MEEILSQVFGIWYLIGAAFVFFMQAGFAMVEAGFTRAKNVGNITMKNTMDFCLGTVAFILIGYALMFGPGNQFIGFGLDPLFDFAGTNWALFTFNLVFCATAATIVSGAMAERTKFISYCIYSVIISALIYPIEARWIWNADGFLALMGFHDFAGSTAIHYVGGICALIGASMLGARIGKFDKDGKPNGIPGDNILVGALGVFILWFGWYGFNGAAATNGLQLSTIFATTTIAPALAAVTTMIYTWVKYGKPDVAMTLNACLGGLVGITAGCDAVNALGAAIIGIVAGLIVPFMTWLLDYKLKIDDPVGAVPVHFACGIWGTIAVGLFACGTDTMPVPVGLFYGGGFGQLGIQLIGLLSVGLWTAVTITLTFYAIKKTIGLRVSAHEEIVGLDLMEHGIETCYAGFAMETETLGGSEEEIAAVETEGLAPYQPTVDLKDAVVTEVVHGTPKLNKVAYLTNMAGSVKLKKEQEKIEIGGMTVSNVMGMGVEKGQTTYYRGAKVQSRLLPKMQADIVVSEVPVEEVVKAAQKALYTGNMGDGKIFIYPVSDVIRISTGATGKEALDYEDHPKA
ncbi:ammonium transporter [Ileibacterium valens]|uniref:Adenylate cyclase n=1 Tax=Ileibacterium valens TaxID=1862668 RepID=A0A1U7NFL4_9FIRM|nr:ammonium transporter [Ileibacterium valens]OLU39216.1 adenylate cyclase [Ileibacterium valens]